MATSTRPQASPYRSLKAPINVDLEVTGRCSLRCSHCYNYWRSEEQHPQLDMKQLNYILDELERNDVMELTVTGGEPFLVPDLVLKILERAKKAAFSVSINSNLTLMTSEIASKLSVHRPNVMTSLFSHDPAVHDSITGLQGSHRKTLNAIKLMHDHRMPVAVNMVVSPKNYEDIYKTGNLVHDLGVRTFTAVRASPPVWANDRSQYTLSREQVIGTLDVLVQLHDELRLHTGNQNCYPLCMIDDWSKYAALHLRNCAAGVYHCAIGADGNVRSCVQSDSNYGNLFEEELGTIWKRMEPWRKGEYLPEKCSVCPLLSQCSGGCRADAQIHTGRINAMDIYCDLSIDTPSVPPELDEDPPWLTVDEKLFLPRLRYRNEAFGVIISPLHSQIRNVMVTGKSARILQEFEERSFTLSEIIDLFSTESERTVQFFTYLAVRRIVRRI